MCYIKLKTLITDLLSSFVNVLKLLTIGNGPLGSPISGKK